MQNLKAIGCALFVVGLGWLGIMTAFVLSGLSAGKVQDTSAAILGIGVFGGVPALILWVVAGVVFFRAKGEAGEMATIKLEEGILERVQTRGKCNLDDLARELDVRPSGIEAGIYSLVGQKLFTGYVNWRGREIISTEAEQLAGGKCPNCGGQIELAGKGMAKCPYCGTETFLPSR